MANIGIPFKVVAREHAIAYRREIHRFVGTIVPWNWPLDEGRRDHLAFVLEQMAMWDERSRNG